MGCQVVADVLVNEGNSLLRKKLFLLVTPASPWLTVDNDLFCHQLTPFSFPAFDLRRTSPITSNPANNTKRGKRM